MFELEPIDDGSIGGYIGLAILEGREADYLFLVDGEIFDNFELFKFDDGNEALLPADDQMSFLNGLDVGNSFGDYSSSGSNSHFSAYIEVFLPSSRSISAMSPFLEQPYMNRSSGLKTKELYCRTLLVFISDSSI